MRHAPRRRLIMSKAREVPRITESDYRAALERERDPHTSDDDKADYWQIIRAYRGHIFYRDHVVRALQRIRNRENMS